MKVIIFNGPPGSGKGYATDFILTLLNGTHQSFKKPLHEIAASILGIHVNCLLENYEDWKKHFSISIDNDDNFERFNNLREFYIHLSENVMKPTFGNNFFGKYAADNLVEGWNVFSDGGFKEEYEEIAKVAKVIVVRLERKGCDFSKDSRGYLDNPDFIITNDDNFKEKLLGLVNEIHG